MQSGSLPMPLWGLIGGLTYALALIVHLNCFGASPRRWRPPRIWLALCLIPLVGCSVGGILPEFLQGRVFTKEISGNAIAWLAGLGGIRFVLMLDSAFTAAVKRSLEDSANEHASGSSAVDEIAKGSQIFRNKKRK